jgi:hypothetical protein
MNGVTIVKSAVIDVSGLDSIHTTTGQASKFRLEMKAALILQYFWTGLIN